MILGHKNTLPVNINYKLVGIRTKKTTTKGKWMQKLSYYVLFLCAYELCCNATILNVSISSSESKRLTKKKG